MNILFILRDKDMIERLGIMIFSSIAKKMKHKVELVFIDSDNIDAVMKKFKPQIVAYSIHTGEHKYIMEFNAGLKKKFKYLALFGGPHATFFPEMIKEKGVDVVCIGEGERAFTDLLNAMSKKKSINSIKDLWVKQKSGKIKKNPQRPLLHDLDSIPFPDRELIYSKDTMLRDHPEKRILIGRGCPFNCTYCFNRQFTKMYGAEWARVRKRSVDNVIEEVREIQKNYPLKFIRIVDDTFILSSIEWMNEFAEKWSKEIKIPFLCNVRANLVTPEVVAALKKAGCSAVFMGLEAADDEVRNGLFKRNMSKKQINEACRLFREAGIKYGFYNVVALPVPNPLEIDLGTLEYNIKLRPAMAWSSLLTPYPRTELGEYCVKHGYFSGDFDSIPSNPKSKSSLDWGDPMLKRKLNNLHKLFGITVEFPFLLPLTKQLIKLPENRLFMYILYGWYGYTLKFRMSPMKPKITDVIKWAGVVRTFVNG